MRLLAPVAFGLATFAATSVGAQPRPSVPSPAQAREQFGVIVQAAGELASALAAGRNLRGGLQSWDRRWRSRLRSLGRVAVPTERTSECEPVEIAALVDGTATSVWTARMFVFAQEGASLAPLARELAARRVRADEAKRRRERGATCTGLPDLAATEASLAERGSDATAIRRLLDVARRGAPTD